MNELRKNWQKKLFGGLFPAVPVPFRNDGSVDWKSQEKYIDYMKTQDIEGAAVWAHTGRGLFLDRETRIKVLLCWREKLPGKIIIAGVGAKIENNLSDKKYLKKTEMMLKDEIECKADIVMPYAPTMFRNRKNKTEKIIEYYELFARDDVPLILFYLYEAAGGIEYSLDLLSELLNIRNVVGIKLATLDSVMTNQDVSALIQVKFPDVTIITGEDRFLPYSFQMGATAALIGMGAVCTNMQKEMINAWLKKEYEKYHDLAQKVDEFAQSIFIDPMEGYIQRLLYVLAKQNIISQDAIFDPLGPMLPKSDIERIDKILYKLNLLR